MVDSGKAKKIIHMGRVEEFLNDAENRVFTSFEIAPDRSTLAIDGYDPDIENNEDRLDGETDDFGETERPWDIDYEALANDIKESRKGRPYYESD